MPQRGTVLPTGGAGFIGSHLADLLLAEGWRVTVVDNFDPYYAKAIKRRNIAPHLVHANYRLIEADIRDPAQVAVIEGEFDVIIHLAAKAGVRASLVNPVGYQQQSNVLGTTQLLKLALTHKAQRLLGFEPKTDFADGRHNFVAWLYDEHRREAG